VVQTQHVIEPVADQVEEVLVGRQDAPLQVELDDGRRARDGVTLPSYSALRNSLSVMSRMTPSIQRTTPSLSSTGPLLSRTQRSRPSRWIRR